MIADAKTKVYGDADPSLTYQVSGLKNGDKQGGLGLVSGNYDLAYQGNNLTITKALLNVIADAKIATNDDGRAGIGGP